jgi:hypothetical protein
MNDHDDVSPAADAACDAYRPFPFDIMPSVVGEFVAECSATTVCDPAGFAVPLLACLASAIGKRGLSRWTAADASRR